MKPGLGSKTRSDKEKQQILNYREAAEVASADGPNHASDPKPG